MNPEPRSEITPLSVSQPDDHDDLRSAFEAAYLPDEHPSIERFLEDTPPAERPAALRELLALALDYGQLAGEQPRPAGDKPRSTAPMGDSTPLDGDMPARTARNLLFGILALQNNFIDRHALIAAFDRWTANKSRSLGALLIDLGKLDPLQRRLLDALVAQHLKLHDGDAEKSLAAVSSLGSVREDLEQFADADVQASMAGVPAGPLGGAPPVDLHAVTATAGTRSGAGTRFTVLRPHAKGGLGQVSVALDEELNREVAFKEIQERYADDSGSRSRFLLEAEITGGLEHPGVVPVYGLGHFRDGRPFYAMRFIQGESLQAAIKRFHGEASGGRKLPGSSVASQALTSSQRAVEFRQLLGRFVDVCNAIEYAHSRGVLHRDLKPGNVMLGKYGETLVVDWGLAKVVGRGEAQSGLDEQTLRPASAVDTAHSLAGQALGTPQYMSPEQAAGRLDLLSRASDVYGLGATLYSLLTGQAPFERGETSEVIARVARGDFRPPREIKPETPHALEAICLKAMALECRDRYPSPRALADDIEHWMADEPVTAQRETALKRAARWFRRHRAWTRSAAAALVLVTAVSIAAAVVVDKSRRAEQDQRIRADANATTAIEAKGRAEKNAAAEKLAKEQARRAIDRYVDTVRESELLNDKRFQPLRRKLLQDALRYFQTFIREHQHDAAARADLADAVSRVAEINYFTGSIDEAVLAHRQAVDTYTALAAEEPGNAEYARRLGKSHSDLGVVQSKTGDRNAALANFTHALTIRGKLAGDHPGVPEYQDDLARSYNNLAKLQHESGDRAAAAENYQQAVAICERLASANPTVATYQHTLAAAYINLSIFERESGDATAAEAALRRSVAVSEKLAADHPAEGEFQRDLAIGYLNLGQLQRDAGDAKSASVSFRHALEAFERLVAENPARAEYQHLLSKVCFSIGLLDAATDQDESALAHWLRAVAIREMLAASAPSAAEYQFDLAQSYKVLADFRAAKGDSAAALVDHKRALAIRQALATANPGVPDYQCELASSFNDLSALEWQKGDIGEATTNCRKALAIRKRIVETNPQVSHYQSDLGESYSNLGALETKSGIREAALDAYASALAIREKLAAANPAVTEYQRSLRNAHAGRAAAFSSLGRHAEAADDWRRAAGLADEATRPILRLHAADALARSGQHEAAVDVVEELAGSEQINGEVLYNSACVMAVAAVAAKDDEGEADRYAARAVELLKRSQAAGFFADAANTAHLEKDPDLDSLRQRDDFRGFLEGLK